MFVYIPTTVAAITRVADDFAIPTGAWYNASEGGIFSQGTVANTGGSVRRYLSINDGTTNNSIQIGNLSSGTGAYMEVRDNIAVQVSQATGAVFALGALAKISEAYKLNDFALTANGSAVISDFMGTIPSVTQIQIGKHANSATYLNGYIQKIKYYPTRTPNTQLQLMTQ